MMKIYPGRRQESIIKKFLSADDNDYEILVSLQNLEKRLGRPLTEAETEKALRRLVDTLKK